MEYIGTQIQDSLSVRGIFTVLHPDLSRKNVGKGESHNFPEIIYINKGSHTIIIDGQEYTLCSGQMIVYAPGAHHKSKGASGAEASIISFEAESLTLPSIYNKIITLNTSQKKIFAGIIEDALKCFERRAPDATVGGMILKQGVEEYILQRIKKQLEFFLIDIQKNCRNENREQTAKSKRWEKEFEQVSEFLGIHLGEPLTLADIAEGCSMSVSKLKMLFREKCGMGPINYFIEMKIDKAKQLILEGEMNFTEISAALGFNSLHYFSRLFKKITGLSPSEYSHTV